MLVTWNLTSRVNKFRSADVLVLSVGKSGRTWLRVLLNKYLALHFGQDFTLDDLHEQAAGVPSILYDHELWSHFSDATWYERLLGSNIAPPAVLGSKKVVIVYRDPRDVVVSMYFQKTKRSRRKIEIAIADFIRDARYGVDNIVRVMNLWHRRLAGHKQCHWLCYETLKADTAGELRRLLEFMAIADIRDDLIAEAVAFAEFGNMKKMEAADAFGSPILRARDTADPDSFKVREGSVGGFRKHFQAPELAYLDDALTRLDPFFPYRGGAAAD
ncbi:sulfotransferase domain-containing protein [Parasulfuritortus cantonensis]|uniref:sulfotransferase domain-containing protein n=1 Tax=Parasulfuritortus cantonensis TaxID=2528202 RepID=UPI0014045E53|nr:sulfotransferase domain-containing protein [Parasulfuritortus cantonensis]